MAMRDAYLAKAAADPKNDPVAPQAIRDHFDRVNSTLRSLEKEHGDAEPKHLDALLDFAARAYRRPLDARRNATICSPITTRCGPRTNCRMKTPSAICIVSVLMSPDFLYRIDLSAGGTCYRLGSVDSALVQLCSGEPVELFPLGQHARR